MRPLLIFNLLLLCIGLIITQIDSFSLLPTKIEDDYFLDETKYSLINIPQFIANAFRELISAVWKLIKLVSEILSGKVEVMDQIKSLADIYTSSRNMITNLNQAKIVLNNSLFG